MEKVYVLSEEFGRDGRFSSSTLAVYKSIENAKKNLKKFADLRFSSEMLKPYKNDEKIIRNDMEFYIQIKVLGENMFFNYQVEKKELED